MELEIDEAGEDSDNARRLLAIANQGQPQLYCKHNGSLDDGFELVTHPMSLSYHRTEMPWEALLREAVRMGYLSHQSGTCGLHIHVSREAFGDTYANQEAAIARVLYFFEKHWEELLKFSRRTQRQLDRWAARRFAFRFPGEVKILMDHTRMTTPSLGKLEPPPSPWSTTAYSTMTMPFAGYRSRKPLVVTTNLTLDALKHPDDLAHARIYDRILEICAPILFGGENLRVEKANETKTAARNLLLPDNAA